MRGVPLHADRWEDPQRFIKIEFLPFRFRDFAQVEVVGPR